MKKHTSLPLPACLPQKYRSTPSSFAAITSWFTRYRTLSNYFQRIVGSFAVAAIFLFCTTGPAFAQVIISEVSPNPLTGESEWVELFNTSSSAIPLSGWKLQDKLSSPSDIYLFSSQILEPQQFIVAELSSAKLNNSGDGVTLFKPDGSIAETMDYTSSEQNKTWQRTSVSSTTFVLTTPTKGSNSALYSLITILTPSSSPTTTPSAPPIPSPTSTPEPTPASIQSTASTSTPTPNSTSGNQTSPPTTSTPDLTTSTPVPSPGMTTAGATTQLISGTTTATTTSSQTSATTATPVPSPSPTPQATFTSSATPTPLPTPTPTPTLSVSPVSSPSPTPSPVPGSSQDVSSLLQLSEIMACPASGTEWVELYNPTAQDITLTNWHIVDEAGNSKTLSGLLQAQKWAVFSWTGSLLNNSGDSFTITTSNNLTIAQASYDSCTAGQSFVFVWDAGSTTTGHWLATATPTPGSENILPATTQTQTTSNPSTPSAQLQPPKATTATSKPPAVTLQNALSAILPTTPAAATSRSRVLGRTYTESPLHDLAFPDISIHQAVFGTSGTSTKSAIFIGNSHLPPKRVVFGGILSGLVTIGSSCAALYGKKILTLLTTLQ